MANTTPLVTTVTKPTSNPKDADATPRVNIQDICEEYYEDILPIIMDKVCRDIRKEVHARLDFREGSRERRTKEDSHHSSARARTTKPKRLKVRDCLRYGDRHVLDRLGHRRQSTFDRLSETYSPSTTKSRPRETNSRESYDDSYSHSYRDGNRSRHMKRRRDNESSLSNVPKNDSSDSSIFRVDAVEDFKEYTLRDYYCWLKTYCCWYKLMLLDNTAVSRLRLLEQSDAATTR
nr:hypothetical protein [Tanacetum cinerariifolium]